MKDSRTVDNIIWICLNWIIGFGVKREVLSKRGLC